MLLGLVFDCTRFSAPCRSRMRPSKYSSHSLALMSGRKRSWQESMSRMCLNRRTASASLISCAIVDSLYSSVYSYARYCHVLLRGTRRFELWRTRLLSAEPVCQRLTLQNGGSLSIEAPLVCRRIVLSAYWKGLYITAGGGTRTLTLLPERDFESRASANSATPAVRKRLFQGIAP